MYNFELWIMIIYRLLFQFLQWLFVSPCFERHLESVGCNNSCFFLEVPLGWSCRIDILNFSDTSSEHYSPKPKEFAFSVTMTKATCRKKPCRICQWMSKMGQSISVCSSHSTSGLLVAINPSFCLTCGLEHFMYRYSSLYCQPYLYTF